MKKKYRVIALFIFIDVIFNTVSTSYFTVYAAPKKSNTELLEICEEARNMNINDYELKDLINSGLSKEDALYYFKVDKIVKLLEERKLEISLSDNIEEITDEEYINNLDYYREKVLQGDEVALKKAIKSLDNLFKGEKYAEKLVNTFSNINKYEIIYPDGTKIIYNAKIISDDYIDIEGRAEETFKKESNKFSLNNSYEGGYEEVLMDEGITYANGNLGAREAEWAFQSGLSYSKVYLYTEYILEDDKTAYITYARGGQSSYGVVNIANSTGAIISRVKNEGRKLPAEARNEVIFTVTSAFGATFLVLSMSLNAGLNWTQYIIFRLNEVEEMYEGFYGAKYTWHAAAYK